MNTKQFSEFSDYEGIDASLEISLFEYGIAWKADPTTPDTYHFLIGVGFLRNGEYQYFVEETMSKDDFGKLLRESWLNKNNLFLQYIGLDSIEKVEQDFPNTMFTTIQYAGVQNVIGENNARIEIIH